MKKRPTTTVEFLDALKEELYRRGEIPRPSDNAISGPLGITRSMISQYRNRGIGFSDDVALRAAELLGLPPGYVLACIHAEREKAAPVKAAWREIAQKMMASAATVAVAAILSSATLPEKSQAADSASLSGESAAVHCILC